MERPRSPWPLQLGLYHVERQMTLLLVAILRQNCGSSGGRFSSILGGSTPAIDDKRHGSLLVWEYSDLVCLQTRRHNRLTIQQLGAVCTGGSARVCDVRSKSLAVICYLMVEMGIVIIASLLSAILVPFIVRVTLLPTSSFLTVFEAKRAAVLVLLAMSLAAAATAQTRRSGVNRTTRLCIAQIPSKPVTFDFLPSSPFFSAELQFQRWIARFYGASFAVNIHS